VNPLSRWVDAEPELAGLRIDRQGEA